MYFSNFFALILLFGTLLSEGKGHSSDTYHKIEVRSHGCGTQPLLELLRLSIANNIATPKQFLEFLDRNEDKRKQVINMLKQYDECIRTADGIRYRKSENSMKWMQHIIKKYLKNYHNHDD